MDVRRSFAPPSTIKSIQRGTFNLNLTSSGTQTISAVNTAKTKLNFLGTYWGSTSTFAELACAMSLSNSTTIAFQRSANSQGCNIAWEAVEYY